MNATLPSRPPRQTALPLEVSARCSLVTLEFVRNLRGCDAESVLNCVGDATHPKFLRWVFNVAVDEGDERRRELRFWKDEVIAGSAVLSAEPRPGKDTSTVVDKILGARQWFPRGEVEVQWTVNAATIMRLVRVRELIEVNRQITRGSLVSFLKRRLQ